jgi:hypothetical protein
MGLKMHETHRAPDPLIALVFYIYHVHDLNIWLDLQILVSTAPSPGGIPFALARKLFRVPSGETIHGVYQALSREV